MYLNSNDVYKIAEMVDSKIKEKADEIIKKYGIDDFGNNVIKHILNSKRHWDYLVSRYGDELKQIVGDREGDSYLVLQLKDGIYFVMVNTRKFGITDVETNVLKAVKYDSIDDIINYAKNMDLDINDFKVININDNIPKFFPVYSEYRKKLYCRFEGIFSGYHVEYIGSNEAIFSNMDIYDRVKIEFDDNGFINSLLAVNDNYELSYKYKKDSFFYNVYYQDKYDWCVLAISKNKTQISQIFVDWICDREVNIENKDDIFNSISCIRNKPVNKIFKNSICMLSKDYIMVEKSVLKKIYNNIYTIKHGTNSCSIIKYKRHGEEKYYYYKGEEYDYPDWIRLVVRDKMIEEINNEIEI